MATRRWKPRRKRPAGDTPSQPSAPEAERATEAQQEEDDLPLDIKKLIDARRVLRYGPGARQWPDETAPESTGGLY